MRHGIVLSGGGAYAAFEIGVLRALAHGTAGSTSEANMDISVLAGSSAGAFNAAVLTSQTTGWEAAVDHLEKVWLERIAGDTGDNGVYRIRGDLRWLLQPDWLFPNVNRILQLAEDSAIVGGDLVNRVANLWFGDPREPLARRIVALFEIGSLICTEPFQVLVRDTISAPAIRESPHQLWVGTTNWLSGHLRAFETRDMTDELAGDAILASAAIPGIFPPVIIGGEPYVDGGVVMNTPLKPAIDGGADVIHAICPDPDVSRIPLRTLPGTLDAFERYVNISNAQRLRDDLEVARRKNMLAEVTLKPDGSRYRRITVHRYAPDIDFGGLLGLLDFRRTRIRSLIAAGELAARSHNCVTAGCVTGGETN